MFLVFLLTGFFLFLFIISSDPYDIEMYYGKYLTWYAKHGHLLLRKMHASILMLIDYWCIMHTKNKYTFNCKMDIVEIHPVSNMFPYICLAINCCFILSANSMSPGVGQCPIHGILRQYRSGIISTCYI